MVKKNVTDIVQKGLKNSQGQKEKEKQWVSATLGDYWNKRDL